MPVLGLQRQLDEVDTALDQPANGVAASSGPGTPQPKPSAPHPVGYPPGAVRSSPVTATTGAREARQTRASGSGAPEVADRTDRPGQDGAGCTEREVHVGVDQGRPDPGPGDLHRPSRGPGRPTSAMTPSGPTTTRPGPVLARAPVQTAPWSVRTSITRHPTARDCGQSVSSRTR